MCPGICENERVIVGMDAFSARAPQRGDVIMFEREDNRAKFLKRVVAVAGDQVAPGPDGIVLVNGKPVPQPTVCGQPNVKKAVDAPAGDFTPLTVPQDSLFVIGDNVNNSYDSRHFGPVNLNQVRGKALLIYFSPEQSRIGCRVL